MLSKDLRQDITGLRAVAVIAVTLYHIAHVLAPENNYFIGGFLGVDIFFVISGFLMTKIIMSGLDAGNFNLLTFYKRRAKRICPALFVVVLFFSGAMLLLFDTFTLVNAFREGLRALGFISNLWFARMDGYFAPSATEIVFLHTWSLSVEWQFYLIYPILLILLNKLVSRKAIGLVVLAGAVASLIFGCVYTTYSPSHSYYYLPSRAYELLIGALAYFYPLSFLYSRLIKDSPNYVSTQQKLAKLGELIGLICILVSLISIDSSEGWPNFWSLLPLFGTYLCIAADNKQTFLANGVFQKLGLWSYAIYLVHWPLIVFFNRLGNQALVWGLLPIILVLGIALHYGVERRRNFGWFFLVLYFALAGALQWGIKTDVAFRGVKNITFPAYHSPVEINTGGIFHLGNLNRPVDFILLGDSFARQYVGTLETKDLHFVTLVLDGCFSLENYTVLNPREGHSWQSNCKARYSNLMKVSEEFPSVPIIWTQNWGGYKSRQFIDDEGNLYQSSFVDNLQQKLPATIAKLANKQRKLFIIDNPSVETQNKEGLGNKCYPLHKMNNFLTNMVADYLRCRDRLPTEASDVNTLLQHIVFKHPNIQEQEVVILKMDEALCNEQGCSIMLDETHEPIFFDINHLSEYGAAKIMDYFLEQKKILDK